MKLLASGRDGDIFEFAPGLVLRKTRDGRSIAHEARTMQYVAEHGYPVPRIEEGERANLVLLDLDATWRVTEDGFRSRSANSWLLGQTLRGGVVKTIADGRVVHAA